MQRACTGLCSYDGYGDDEEEEEEDEEEGYDAEEHREARRRLEALVRASAEAVQQGDERFVVLNLYAV
eukprot:Cvel_2321.t1-p1 / transcript=Cvel_2321.t1 / gene=Cvel_2321 / organism=Chromera_velia_CCMP2878 / gene_product=hypothetical protein / transcript_product=hypothetical protein / location=Cvel_scaffold89:122994-123194(+) / protein_length=67 / sequence_SO=supercontig / SO=protein_coding / is_pseudo=false